MPRYSQRTGLLQEYQVGPYDAPHLYLQWGGKLPGLESWSCGIRLKKVTGGVTQGGEPSGMIAAATAAITAFHQRAATMIHSSAKLSFVKLNGIALNGTYMTESTFETPVADLSGGMTTPLVPNQVALAATLETGFSRGPAHRGRFYLPLPAIQVAADGVIGADLAASVAGSADTLLADLNAVNADFKVAVFSRKAGAPASRLVNDISVGRVLDTQRRRRRSLVENNV